jgi:hypothetical protein
MAVATRYDVEPLCDIHAVRMIAFTLNHLEDGITSPAYRCTKARCGRIYDWWRGYFEPAGKKGKENDPNRLNCKSDHRVKIAMYLASLLSDGGEDWRCPCVGCNSKVHRASKARHRGSRKAG